MSEDWGRILAAEAWTVDIYCADDSHPGKRVRVMSYSREPFSGRWRPVPASTVIVPEPEREVVDYGGVGVMSMQSGPRPPVPEARITHHPARAESVQSHDGETRHVLRCDRCGFTVTRRAHDGRDKVFEALEHLRHAETSEVSIRGLAAILTEIDRE